MATEQPKIHVPSDLQIPVNVKGLLITINNIEYAIGRGAFNAVELTDLATIVNTAVTLKQEVNAFLSSYVPPAPVESPETPA